MIWTSRYKYAILYLSSEERGNDRGMKRRNAATGELMHIGSIRKSKAAMHFKKNDTIYILTEERPKITTIDTILDEYSKLMKDPLVRTGSGETKLRPVFADGKFLFEYEVENVHTQECKNIIPGENIAYCRRLCHCFQRAMRPWWIFLPADAMSAQIYKHNTSMPTILISS